MDCHPEPIMLEPRAFTDHYIVPVINHPISRFVRGTAVELIKIVAAKIFLECVLEKALSQAKMPVKAAWTIAVAAPVIEEIIFRGAVQRGIGLAQKGWNYYVIQRELTQEELAVQRTWRVQISAIVFAAVHLTNFHPTKVSKLVQFTWCYLGGVAYGYLSDRYKSLSVSILAHGFNNMLIVCVAAYADPKIALTCLAGIVINPVAAYTLGKPEWIQNTTARMREFGHSCFNIPDNMNIVQVDA